MFKTRLYIIVLLLLMSISHGGAQTKLDSLLQALNSHKKEDKVKLDLLNNIAKEYQYTDILAGLKTADEAIALAQQLKDETRLAEAFYTKSKNFFQQNNYAQAAALTRQSLHLYEQLANKKGIANCLDHLGSISFQLADFSKALEYANKSLGINEQIGHKIGIANNLNNQGNVYYTLSNNPKAIELYHKALKLYEEVDDKRGLSGCLANLGGAYTKLSDNHTALAYFQRSLRIHEQLGNSIGHAVALTNIGVIHSNLQNIPKAQEYHRKALNILSQIGIKDSSIYLLRIALNYQRVKQYEEAKNYYQRAIMVAEQLDKKGGLPDLLNNLGFLHYELGEYVTAWGYFVKGLAIAERNNDKGTIPTIQLSMGELIRDAPDTILAKIGISLADRYKKTLEYFNKGKQGATEAGSLLMQRYAWQDLSIAYENQKDYHKALDAYKNYIVLRDSILNNDKEKKISRLIMQYDFDKQADSLKLEEQITGEKLKQQVLLARQQQQQILLAQNDLMLISKEKALINKEKDLQQLAYLKTQADLQNEQLQKREKEKLLIIAGNEKRIQQANAIKIRDKNRIRTITLLAALALFSLIAFVLFYNNRRKQKTNMVLQQQKQQTEEQKLKVEQTLGELKSTQAQLIQREKMASLGDLTVGIAHEIQNPLNFVNNFSELNTELISDMEEQISKGNFAEGIAMASAIKANMQKINLHGKRADGIVKSMQLHSRGSQSKKEPVNINALSNEYLRLSYRSFQAADKTYTAVLNTHFDERLSTMQIMQQDLAGVLQSLFNNAFYATAQKSKSNSNGYEPTIWLTTKLNTTATGLAQVQINIKDNGTGIPQQTTDKIFQPFFTTKPTGQGTGLGLSLSYDIVTKGNGGSIKVESKEGEFAEFIIELPV